MDVRGSDLRSGADAVVGICRIPLNLNPLAQASWFSLRYLSIDDCPHDLRIEVRAVELEASVAE
jgi:hypothetical protein